jgi:hypothetical protein
MRAHPLKMPRKANKLNGFSLISKRREKAKKTFLPLRFNRESTTYAPPQARNPSKIALLSNCHKFPCISMQTFRAFSAPRRQPRAFRSRRRKICASPSTRILTNAALFPPGIAFPAEALPPNP